MRVSGAEKGQQRQAGGGGGAGLAAGVAAHAVAGGLFQIEAPTAVFALVGDEPLQAAFDGGFALAAAAAAAGQSGAGGGIAAFPTAAGRRQRRFSATARPPAFAREAWPPCRGRRSLRRPLRRRRRRRRRPRIDRDRSCPARRAGRTIFGLRREDRRARPSTRRVLRRIGRRGLGRNDRRLLVDVARRSRRRRRRLGAGRGEQAERPSAGMSGKRDQTEQEQSDGVDDKAHQPGRRSDGALLRPPTRRVVGGRLGGVFGRQGGRRLSRLSRARGEAVVDGMGLSLAGV